MRPYPLVLLAALASPAWPAEPPATTPQAPKAAPAKGPAPKRTPQPTVRQLERALAEQRATIEEQQRLIAEQQAGLARLEAARQEQAEALEGQRRVVAEQEEVLAALKKRLDELEQQMPAVQEQLKAVEEAAQREPELPPTVVSAGEFPGSMRIPGTDAAIKFGGRIRVAGVFTLDDLGSSDRFVTHTIPVEPGDAAAGNGRRTVFSANTSRFNFDLRTPTGVGQMRAFIEGDFFGTNATDDRANFRLRHAFAQFRGLVVGQTWSTFSDPAATVEDLDFEGINGENVIRQPQIRYDLQVREGLSAAVAAETPAVSLTGGKGENIVPDLVGRAVWTFQGDGHLQTAVVLRQIRGTSEVDPTRTRIEFAWGASLSGVLPVRVLGLQDRLVFQANVGQGNARYINDLNSLGGQDAAFDPATGELHAIRARGWYVDYEHAWSHWETTRAIRLRSSFIWSRVQVTNLGFQPADAYHRTDRYAANLVFSPIQRIDAGLEVLYGQRENKDGHRGSASQVQAVGIFRF